MNAPKVSMGMPVYNGARHLREALAGVLAQTHENFELVVVDNASTDETRVICEQAASCDSRVRYFRNETNIGAAPNFNLALDLSDRHSPYFKWVAHDDVMDKRFLACCVELLEGNPEAVMAFPKRQLILADGRPCPPEGNDDTNGPIADWSFDRISFAELLRLPGLHMPIFDFAVIRSDALRRTRRMQSFVASDNVLVAELRLLGAFREWPEVLFYQRLHHLEPGWKERGTVEGEAAWLDPANENKRQPHVELKLLLELWRAVEYVPLRPAERIWRGLETAVFIGQKGSRYLNPLRWMAKAAKWWKFYVVQANAA